MKMSNKNARYLFGRITQGIVWRGFRFDEEVSDIELWGYAGGVDRLLATWTKADEIIFDGIIPLDIYEGYFELKWAGKNVVRMMLETHDSKIDDRYNQVYVCNFGKKYVLMTYMGVCYNVQL